MPSSPAPLIKAFFDQPTNTISYLVADPVTRRAAVIALSNLAIFIVAYCWSAPGRSAVDRTLDDYVSRKRLGGHWTIAEKVAASISANPEARELIARGPRMAERLDAEFYVLHVKGERDKVPEKQRSLQANFQFARNLGGTIVELDGSSIPSATAEFASLHRVTQMIFGRSALKGLKRYLYFLAIQRFMSAAPHCDVHIVTQEE